MMPTPVEVIRCIVELNQGQPHERRLLNVEPQIAVRSEVFFELNLLLLLGKVTPVDESKRRLHTRPDYLNGCLNLLGDKMGPQNCMSFDDVLPGPLKSRNIQIPTQRKADLIEIHSRPWMFQGVE